MFAPRYFPVRHFAPRFFPPGVEEVVTEFDLDLPLYVDIDSSDLGNVNVPDVDNVPLIVNPSHEVGLPSILRSTSVIDANSTVGITSGEGIVSNTIISAKSVSVTSGRRSVTLSRSGYNRVTVTSNPDSEAED